MPFELKFNALNEPEPPPSRRREALEDDISVMAPLRPRRGSLASAFNAAAEGNYYSPRNAMPKPPSP
jgi:hypothetical protein